MKSTLFIFCFGLLLLSMQNCTSEPINEIEDELVVHFDNFVEEASIHGMEISLADIDLSAYVKNIESRGTLGQCKSYSNGSKQVVIDEPFWNNADELEREYIVFHELGHCVLGRDHNDNKDAAGHCVSIMQSGDNDCSGIYNLENRNSLLIELFSF